jgi:putative transposase
MGNRDYKQFAPGNLMHVYNRGNNKGKIFLDKQDRRAFLFRLGLCLGYSEDELRREKLLSLPYSRIRITEVNKNEFKLHGFCLMPNHFHFLVEQVGDKPISSLILKLCTSYSKYFNQKYRRVGHVFQDKFKAVQIESNSQLMWSSAYVHMNAVKDGLVKNPDDYVWSSYADFAIGRNLPIVCQDLIFPTFGGKKNFIEQTLNFEAKNSFEREVSKAAFGTL